MFAVYIVDPSASLVVVFASLVLVGVLAYLSPADRRRAVRRATFALALGLAFAVSCEALGAEEHEPCESYLEDGTCRVVVVHPCAYIDPASSLYWLLGCDVLNGATVVESIELVILEDGTEVIVITRRPVDPPAPVRPPVSGPGR